MPPRGALLPLATASLPDEDRRCLARHCHSLNLHACVLTSFEPGWPVAGSLSTLSERAHHTSARTIDAIITTIIHPPTHPPTHPPIHTHTPRQHCGCSEVSAYPEGRHVITPNIAKLAKTSVVFERAYVSVALCMPSRTALLTSRRPDTSRSWTIEPDQCVAHILHSRRPARPNQNSDHDQAVIKVTTTCRHY
jgi:hypothetical protein